MLQDFVTQFNVIVIGVDKDFVGNQKIPHTKLFPGEEKCISENFDNNDDCVNQVKFKTSPFNALYKRIQIITKKMVQNAVHTVFFFLFINMYIYKVNKLSKNYTKNKILG